MKYFYTLAVMLFTAISAFAADFTTVSTTPADGANVDRVAEIILNYPEAVTVDTSKLPFIYLLTEEGEYQVSGSVAELSEDGTSVHITPIIFVGFPMPTNITEEGHYVMHLQAGFVTSANGSSLAEDLTFSIGNVTALSSLQLQAQSPIRDLQGREVTTLHTGNAYIINGKKVICQ